VKSFKELRYFFSCHPRRSGRPQSYGKTVHIFFQIGGYPKIDSELTQLASTAFGLGGATSNFAALGAGYEKSTHSVEDARAHFEAIVDRIPKEDWFYSRPATDGSLEKVDVDPIFLRAEGARSTRTSAAIQTKQLAKSPRVRGYALRQGELYFVRLSYHQPQWSEASKLGLVVRVQTDPKEFSNPPESMLEISSPYDQEDFLLFPRVSDNGILSRVSVDVVDEKGQRPDVDVVRAGRSIVVTTSWQQWFELRPRIAGWFRRLLNWISSAAVAVLPVSVFLVKYGSEHPSAAGAAFMVSFGFWLLVIWGSILLIKTIILP
jgi:hypothetical protein